MQIKQQSKIEKLAKAQGIKLGFLIGASNMSDEEKNAWASLLLEMSLEQIDDLTEILEAKYLDEKTKDVDEKFKTDLEYIKDKYNQKREKLNQNTLEKIQKMTENIK